MGADGTFLHIKALTGDLGGKSKTHEYADAIISKL